MWVAIELATLTTVLMVGIYRTHEALEAAWKYFILGSVGIALALFGTILVYMAARPVIGEGPDGMVWTVLIENAASLDPALLNLAFVRSEEHTSELQSLMRNSYAVLCWKKKKKNTY